MSSIKDKWYNDHKCCPECGSEDLTKSIVAVVEKNGEFRDDVNTAKCNKCGWKGMVKNLTPSKEAEKEDSALKIQATIRTLDHDEGDGRLGVYLNGYDLLESIEKFGHALVDNLKDEQTIEYTKNLLNEIFKMITGTMLAHTKQRFEKMNEEETKKDE